MNQDYLRFLQETGITQQQMETAMALGIDFIPDDIHGIEIRDSKIQGRGTFSTKSFGLGDVIGDGMRRKRWTSLGRFANHSSIPNMRAEKTNNGFCFVAERAIRENEELTVNYRTVKAALTPKEDHHV